MALLDMVAELTGVIQGLSPFLAETYINRALTDIYRERLWSFLVTDGAVVCPTAITTGTVNLTQYSATVTLDSAASAALQTQITGAAEPGILQLQMRFGSQPTTGGIYSIIACDNSTPTAVILTLDRVVQEPTNAASNYQIYRCYVIPPLPDFQKWLSFVDINNAIAITNDRLNLTSAQLDRRDPQRAAQSLAYFLASWGGNRISDPVTGDTVPNATVDASTPIYELWPHPTQGQTFYVRFRRAGAILVQPTDELPDQIPESFVLAKAYYAHVYPFVMANVANFPAFKGANGVALITQAKAEYSKLLLDAKRNDNDQQLQDVQNRGHGLRSPRGDFKSMNAYPIDANFIQSHLVRF